MVGDDRGALVVQPGEDKDGSIPKNLVADNSSNGGVSCLLYLRAMMGLARG